MMFGLGDTEDKIRTLLRVKFNGDSKAAFDAYATAGKMGEEAIDKFLKDAGVGGVRYRSVLVSLALRRADANDDDAIDYAEFVDTFGPNP
jgi:hypothetical protein